MVKSRVVVVKGSQVISSSGKANREILSRMLARGLCLLASESKAEDALRRFFEPKDKEWRGFPSLPDSGVELRPEYEPWDAKKRHEDVTGPLTDREFKDPAGCRCGEVIRGEMHSWECPLFGRSCKPDTPVGPCMVSVEGACAIEYKYGKRPE